MARYLTDPFLWPIVQLEQMQRTLTFFSRDSSPFPARYRTTFAKCGALLSAIKRELQRDPDGVTAECLREHKQSLHLAMSPELPPAASAPAPDVPAPVRPLAPLLPMRAPHKHAHWLLVLAAESQIPRRTAYLWWQEFCIGHHLHVRAKYADARTQEAFITWIRQMQAMP